jgi:hypothetical protein
MDPIRSFIACSCVQETAAHCRLFGLRVDELLDDIEMLSDRFLLGRHIIFVSIGIDTGEGQVLVVDVRGLVLVIRLMESARSVRISWLLI